MHSVGAAWLMTTLTELCAGDVVGGQLLGCAAQGSEHDGEGQEDGRRGTRSP